VNHTSLRRRLFTGAAGLMLGATAAMTLAAPAQATEGEESPSPAPESPSPAPESPSPSPEPPNGGLPEDVDADFVTIITCDFYVFIFRNNGEEGGLEFTLTTNQDTTAGAAPDFVPLLDAEPDEDGFIDIPPEADIENPAALGAGESVGSDGALAVGDAEAIGFVSAADLEITVEVTVGGEAVELENPVASFNEDAEGLGCDTGDDNGDGGELPVTGNTTLLIAGGAAALLALGGGLFLIARRRRVTFTA
jgi:LPXTG-motif cell wall-anchored protein